ncbi:retron St85 family RNA-directed DNA polymerase [Aeromonas hydrophila]|uniref:retron St85 family RNA-directed DNA polymerase n=1 Tax=Aeromonas hydrophila TaxID=644 RepID=UPI003D1FB476
MNIIEKISDRIYISHSELVNFVHTAPRRYKKYYIFKRDGVNKRQIAQPSKEVKFIQRLAVSELKELLPVHECATAYVTGRSIKENAERHRLNKFLLKMDLVNFFPSITPGMLFSVMMKNNFDVSNENKLFLGSLFFWKLRRNSKLRLSIGAPSSPFISNVVMYYFDQDVNEYCKQCGITYTRYADDMTFTTNNQGVLSEVPYIIKMVLKRHFGTRMRVNSKKTVFSSKAFNRHITGITITNDGKLSLGREKKRLISSMVHHFILGKLDDDSIYKLKGLLAYAMHIEPSFMIMIERKYSKDEINNIFSIAVKK